MKTFFLKNWKTTLAGLIAIGSQLAVTIGAIPVEVANAISVIAASLGLVVAKDSDKTGV